MNINLKYITMKQPFKIVLLAVLLLHLAVSIIIYIRDEQTTMAYSIAFTCIAILLVAVQGKRKPKKTFGTSRGDSH